ncbi:MAG TPA: ABC transporter substrate-binding protein [Acidimicrobiales bacterium]|nr:ABC transporter substrate-binding protein [Acidimicrobiales bacterium]
MPEFSLYSPICLPRFSGDNGGATAMGVTGDSVLLVRYRPQADPATTATLAAIGGDDDPAVVDRTAKAFVRYYNTHLETYGREVKYVTFDGTGEADSDEVNRADAVTIATQLKPFAVVHLTSAASQAFTEELAARGVICVCTTSNSREYYKLTSPYIWTILPTLEEYYENITEYWAKRLKDRPAKWAGTNVRVSNDVRKFGLIYLEGAGDVISPYAKLGREYFERLLADQGMKLERAVAYTFDIQQQQQQSTNIIGQMVAAGVNVVTCVCDPLYPIFLTSEATRQGYFPEWFINGVALQDTTFFGRTYDQQQWQHAYGFSPLWVFTDAKENSSGYRTYHHVESDFEGNGVNVWQAPIQTVFNGIHYAGPRLTPETWSQGLFLAPARGGRVNAPLVKFTPEDPGAIKDWVEVWWDVNGTGNDELTKPGKGILLKSNNGVRYTLGAWPAAEAFVFSDDPAPIFVSTENETFDHDADGHTHENDPPCRSCG